MEMRRERGGPVINEEDNWLEVAFVVFPYQ